MNWLKTAAAACAAIGLALTGATAASARNRTTEMLVADVAARAGVSTQTFLDRSVTQQGNDTEVLPGVFESSGGFSYAYGGSSQTLIAVRIFNENDFAICARFNGALLRGPMAGTEQNASLGFNILIDARSSELMIANAAKGTRSAGSSSDYATRYLFWLAAPPSQERRCSSVAPAGVEYIDSAPLPPAGETVSEATPELYARLGLIPPQAQSAPAAPALADSTNRLAWYWLDRIKPKDAGPVERIGILTNEYGPFVTSLAFGRLGNATDAVTVTDWFYNAADRSVCVLGRGGYRVLGANGVTKPVEEGAKVVPSQFGTWIASVARINGPQPPNWQVLWDVDYYVWPTPKSPATDADCANSFNPANFSQGPSPRKDGQIILHPVLGGPSPG